MHFQLLVFWASLRLCIPQYPSCCCCCTYCTKPTKVPIDAMGPCAHQFERQSSLDGTREQRRRQQILQYCSLERDTPWGRKDFIGRAWRFSKAMPDEWI